MSCLTNINILTNVFRALVAGIGIVAAIDGALVHYLVSVRSALLLTTSGICLAALNIEAMSWDISDTTSCAGRSLTLYIMSYISQLCLDLYQTNLVYIFVKKEKSLQFAALTTLAMRVICLIVALTQYSDPPVRSGMCVTVYPSNMLIVEKSILYVFNLINFGLLFRAASKLKRFGGNNAQATVSGVLKLLMSQEAFSFILSIVLGVAFIIATFVLKSIGGWAYSLTAALGNGIACFILHFQFRLNFRRIKLKPKTTNKSGKAPDSHNANTLGNTITRRDQSSVVASAVRGSGVPLTGSVIQSVAVTPGVTIPEDGVISSVNENMQDKLNENIMNENIMNENIMNEKTMNEKTMNENMQDKLNENPQDKLSSAGNPEDKVNDVSVNENFPQDKIEN